MNSDPRRTDGSNSQNSLFAAARPRVVVMFLLFASAGVFEARNLTSLSALSNGDIWWHLRTGIWILQNHGVPHSGLFSQSTDQPWIASSWAYDLKLAMWYKLLGLGSIPVFSICLKAALAVITFLLAGGRRGNFWAAIVISAVAQYVLAAVPATPAYCSTLLFGVELLLLLENRRASSLRQLFWLSPLFIVWANLDVSFVYGLALLILFFVALAVENLLPSVATHPLGPEHRTQDVALARNVVPIATAVVVATFITPYFYHPYGVFFLTAFSPANSYLPDCRPLGFRQPQDYVLLLFVMAAFLALGLRRSRDPFLIPLLAIGAARSFHSQRDIWLVTLAAVAVIGEAMPIRAATAPDARPMPLRYVLNAATLAAAILALAIALRISRRPEALLAKTGLSYPVAACNYIREHRLPQPLFNAFEWGGFLTWYLPEYPVAIDGRTNLYGDDFIIEYFKAMNVEARYTAFAAMANARTVLLPRTAIMADVLSSVPGFKVAYNDNVAVVLTRDPGTE